MPWGALAALAIFVGLVALAFRARAKSGSGRTFNVGPGAAGAIYDMLNQDKRRAIEIIVEGRAEHRDPETADDTPPEDHPKRPQEPSVRPASSRD